MPTVLFSVVQNVIVTRNEILVNLWVLFDDDYRGPMAHRIHFNGILTRCTYISNSCIRVRNTSSKFGAYFIQTLDVGKLHQHVTLARFFEFLKRKYTCEKLSIFWSRRHHMETSSALLPHCGESDDKGTHGNAEQCVSIVCLDALLDKQSSCRWFETQWPSCDINLIPWI